MTFRLADLTYRYDRPREGHRENALHGVTAELPPGVTAVLGRNGSGKSTLLSLLGLLTPWRPRPGAVTYRGPDGERDYAALSAADRDRLRRHDFGFVLQSSYLLPHLSCRENVEIPLALAGKGRSERRRIADGLFRQADPTGDLFRLRTARPREVSGGEQQRVAILRAIVHNPPVLFADEPFSSLDPFNSELILALLREWVDGRLGESGPRPLRTLILVSHVIGPAVEFAGGRCVLMRDGRLVFGRLTGPNDLTPAQASPSNSDRHVRLGELVTRVTELIS